MMSFCADIQEYKSESCEIDQKNSPTDLFAEPLYTGW